ncbi:MAG: hypothetical protein Q4E03_06165 [Trueperella sp.]|nr:hypothetical protein [Trueperella sp.]
MVKKIAAGVGIVLAAVLAVVLGYVAYVFVSYDRIEDNLALEVSGAASESVQIGQNYRISSANMGFGAYSDDYSFFMDGGEESRARSPEAVQQNIGGATQAVADQNADIMLFQEVDLSGTRSHKINERDLIVDRLRANRAESAAKSGTQFDYTYAINYDSAYLFYPISKPHGKNKSGILTASDFPIVEATRRSLPIEEGFSKFMDLDRCYVKHRIPVAGGKDLLIYNVHLSAYTTNPDTANNQLKLLFADMQAELAQGNYAIAGGDFNKDLLGDSADIFGHPPLTDNWAVPIPPQIIPDDVKLIAPFDAEHPVASCRNADRPYGPDDFVVTVDGFVVTNNVSVATASVVDTGFKWSDHNPVTMDFQLLPDK